MWVSVCKELQGVTRELIETNCLLVWPGSIQLAEVGGMFFSHACTFEYLVIKMSKYFVLSSVISCVEYE